MFAAAKYTWTAT